MQCDLRGWPEPCRFFCPALYDCIDSFSSSLGNLIGIDTGDRITIINRMCTTQLVHCAIIAHQTMLKHNNGYKLSIYLREPGLHNH